ncbi:MAG: hypothetical protein ACJ8A6_01930 [Gemmatimonadales bacterium]
MLKASPPVEAAVMSELISGLLGLVASFWQAVSEDITVASKTELKARIGAREDQRLIPGMGLLNEEDTASSRERVCVILMLPRARAPQFWKVERVLFWFGRVKQESSAAPHPKAIFTPG